MPVDLAPDQLVVTTIRTLSIDAVQRANSGHPGAPMGLAPVGWMLFGHHLRYDPLDPAWPNRDRFVLSAGHASALLYSLLHLTGYAVTIDDLMEFRQWGSATPGHPERGDTPGVEVTTGPLGQGVRQRRRARPRRVPAGQAVQPPRPRDHRSPHLVHLLGRRPHGGHLLRGGVALPGTLALAS